MQYVNFIEAQSWTTGYDVCKKHFLAAYKMLCWWLRFCVRQIARKSHSILLSADGDIAYLNSNMFSVHSTHTHIHKHTHIQLAQRS